MIGVQEAMVTNGQDMPADLIAGLQTSWTSYRPSGGSPKIIFFKKSRFTKLAQGTANLPNPYARSHICYDRSGGKKFSWVKLRDVTSGKDYFIGNTHLAFSDACTAGRRAQATEIKRVITAQAGTLPVIVTGDFNTDDQKPSLASEEEGTRLFRSARFDGDTTSDEATFNSRWNGSGTNNARIDFIFNSGREITSSAPSIDLSPGTDTGTPSDHFPILATIRAATFEPGSQLVQITDGENDTTQVFFADVNGDRCADAISWSSTFGSGATW